MKYNDNGLWKTLNVKVTDTLPVGTIMPYAGATIPSNYMKCEGQALSRIEYDILFSAIGTTYGVGDGSTTFNLPNLKGRVITGIDSNDTDFDTLGETGGEKTHTLTVDEMPSHNHNITYIKSASTPLSSNGLSGYSENNNGVGTNTNAIQNAGEDQPHNNLQPYIVLNYIIKVLDAPAIQAQVVNGYSTSSRDSYSCNYTNQIVESGSNENGDWIKYANGNLICYGSASVQSPTYSDWYGFCRTTNDITATLPTTFKDNDYKIIATSFTFGYFGMLTRTKTTNSFVFKGFTHNQSSYNPSAGTFDYIAIGKWK